MQEACVVDFNGHKFVFTNVNNECPTMFTARSWFIARHHGKADLGILTMLSHVWVNQTYMDVRYDEKIIAFLHDTLITPPTIK